MHGQLLFVGLKGEALLPEEVELFRRVQPGGYILFTRNVKNAEQLRALTDSLRELSYEDPFIAIDNEGGRVWRTGAICSPPPSAVEMREHANMEQVAYCADLIAEHQQLLGINMNFGPVLDIDHHWESGAANALRGRCYGRNANEVLDKAGLTNRRMRGKKLLTCGKHFPSCGLAESDPHHDLPVVSVSMETLLRQDLIPYMTLLPEMNAVMTAHVTYPEIDPKMPASLSWSWISGVLRNQIGFKGLAITDDLDMGAIGKRYERGEDVKQAILAGNDMAMICHDTHTLDQAMQALETLDPWVIEERLKRIQKQRKSIPIPRGFDADAVAQNATQIADLGKEILEGVEKGVLESNSPVESY